MPQHTYRVMSSMPRAEGGLKLFAQPYAGPNVEARGFVICIVPEGELADMLSQALQPNEVWELTLADDGATVIGAAFRGEPHA